MGFGYKKVYANSLNQTLIAVVSGFRPSLKQIR